MTAGLRVLGIDPGLTRCGFGVVQGRPGKPLLHLHHEVARTPADAPIGERLDVIAAAVAHQLEIYRPAAVAIERVFSQVNIKTVMGVAQASGVAILAAQRAGVPISVYTPSEVKAAVTGSGRADKAQVQTMIARIMRLDAPPKPADAADALAIAACHIWRGSSIARRSDAAAQARDAQLAEAQAQVAHTQGVYAAKARAALAREAGR